MSNWISMQVYCLYCLQVGRRFGLVCRSQKSVARDRCSKQMYYNWQRKWYKTHCCMCPGKSVKIWQNIWSAWVWFPLPFWCYFIHVFQTMVLIDQQLYSFILPMRFFHLKSLAYVLFRIFKFYLPRIQRKSRAGKRLYLGSFFICNLKCVLHPAFELEIIFWLFAIGVSLVILSP